MGRPVVEPYLPAAQEGQDAAPAALKVPGEQLTQLDAALPLNLPAAQLMQPDVPPVL